MTDEIIKNVFRVAMSSVDGDAKKLQEEYKSRHDALHERVRYLQELMPVMQSSLTDIVRRCKQMPPDAAAQAYEKEITVFMQNLLRIQQATGEELLKSKGALTVFENVSQIYAQSPVRFETELSRANDIQQKQQSGDLEKARKPGERPNKIKDIRNYSEKTDK